MEILTYGASLFIMLGCLGIIFLGVFILTLVIEFFNSF